MKRKKILIVSLVLIVLISTFAFISIYKNKGNHYESSESAMEDKAYDGNSAPRGDFYSITPESGSVNYTSTEIQNNRKIIKSGYISINTEEFDKIYNNIISKSTQLNGYIQSSRISKNDVYIDPYNKESKKEYLRNGYIEVRIPQDSFENFFDYLSSLGEVISSNTNNFDITESYDTTEIKLEGLLVQKSRILEIMKEAKVVSDLILLENELNRIRTEIEIATTQLSGWDKEINYSNVVIDLREVKSSDNSIQIKDDNMWQSAKNGFIKTTNNLIAFLQFIIVFFISSIPVLFLLAFLVIIIVIIRKTKFKNKE